MEIKYNSMKRVSKKQRMLNDKKWWDALIITIPVIVVIIFGCVYFHFRSKEIALDPVSLCPLTGVVDKTVVLIDRTDPLSEMQQRELLVYLNDIKTSIPLHASISIYEMEQAKPKMLQPKICICNPGSGENKSQFFANPKLIKKIWEKNFSDKLDLIITQLMEPLEVQGSPIMESIKAISIAEFIGNKNQNIQKRLIIVSDMIQHTLSYSQYNHTSDFHSYKKSSSYQLNLSELNGVNVEILYIKRHDLGNVQGKAHIQFWQQYIYSMGGTLTRIKSVN